MQCWPRLAIATARAEFPEFTVMHAMSIFFLHSSDLGDDGRVEDSTVDAGGARVSEKLQTSAKAFRQDGGA
eukprot:4212812-Lingulodinium_polyedra.AAC.1